MKAALRPVLRIMALWRQRFPMLTLGLVIALASAAVGVGLMASAGARLAGALVGVGAGAVLLAGWVRGLGVARIVLRYLERLVAHDATFRALGDLRVWFFRGLARRAAGGLGFLRAGDMLARVVNDVEALDGLYLRLLIPLSAVLVLLPAVVVFAARQSLALAATLAVLVAFVAFFLPWRAARGTLARGEHLSRAIAQLRITVLDAVSGLREVRAFGAEGRMLALVQARSSTLFEAQHDEARGLARASFATMLAAQAALFAVLLAASLRPAGAAGIASATTLFLTLAAFEAIALLPRAGALAGRISAAARRVLENAEAPVHSYEPPAPILTPRGFALRFEAVSFRWREDRRPVLDGLTLEVPEGAHVAVLGPSGAGKSTLAALALKIASPESGRLSLGGADYAALPADFIRRHVAWLGQTTHLFDDTIRANLRLARPDANEPALWQALEAARIADVVRDLPDGLDTWVGEGGTRFSGGQGRRLALARALLSPAPILILDEPCAGLDAATERAFLATLNEAAAGRSVLLITHRLTGVERLDRIWRLAGGKAIAAAG